MPGKGTTFEQSPSYLYSSESVTEGHPDKLCDQVSDGILDAIYAQDPSARGGPARQRRAPTSSQ